MPGLNQLKQFSDDIRSLGDEVKIRAQRGERPASVPLPKGISEADDSDDFIIGIPDVNKKDEPQGEESASLEDILGTDDNDVSGLDSLLEPQVSVDDDALADFLNEPLDSPEALPSSEPSSEETPLEDLDIDSLLPSTESDEMPNLKEFDKDLQNSDSGDAASPENLSSESLDTAPTPNDADDFSFDVDSLIGDSDSPSEASDISVENSNVEEPQISEENASNESEPDLTSFDADLGDIGDFPSFDETESASVSEKPISSADSATNDDFSLDADSILNSQPEEPSSEETSTQESEEQPPSVDLGDLGSLDLTGGDNFSLSDFSGSDSLSNDAGELDLTSDAESSSDDSAQSFDMGNFGDLGGSDSTNSNVGGDFSSFDIDSLVSDSEEPSLPDASEVVPGDNDEISLESFDTSGMNDVDFGSSKFSSDDEFPATDDGLNNDDDFVLDSSFEIPGFSDTDTADLGKKKPLLDTVDFSNGKEGVPRNSLTEEEYAQFKKNLSNYPLNLRIALEDFIARDEFTDDAVFEIIEKVLKKTSARQLATQLEKILDISIDIPRDFERRSFAEYEAYKQSFQYQLKNRIIPAAIVGLVLCFVCFGLFKAGEFFIYRPVMANINYKQGYTLLEANEFPQSEEKFKTAVSYKPVKKWFFKYALGYRNKKQFERAGQMYKNILRYFNHDKQAGLDYAEMELYDRANYSRAEEIVRREVLDYHINDADGILMLGDVFLEWAEVEPEKYELAKQQYLDLIQRYGMNNIYLSRMLRYNIRTDKLREVLTYKNMLYQNKQDKKNLKNLSANDWAELSGYLLEKLYGTLSKNDEYLRSSIEDVLDMLNLATKADPANPIARYNLARYFIHNGNTEQAKIELERSLDLFKNILVRNKKNVYREINATRILGELYALNREYLKAQTVYTRGINLYNEEHEASELEGDENTGKLFADMGDLDYFISGEMDDALYNYEKAIEIKNDTPSINFRVGAIYYNRKNYDNALSSFIKVAEQEPRDPNILLSLGNVLSLRGDNFAAKSYYSDLLNVLDYSREKQKLLLPQEDEDDYAVVDLYLKANNNLGVTLYRLAHQTGNSNMNAEAIVRLSDSIRAWDALTRNPKTMIRMEGSNLAAQNSKYITHPYPDFEPAIYTDIPRILSGEKGLE